MFYYFINMIIVRFQQISIFSKEFIPLVSIIFRMKLGTEKTEFSIDICLDSGVGVGGNDLRTFREFNHFIKMVLP